MESLTLQHGELGTGVDLTNTVGGRAFIDGFVTVAPQRLDSQHRTRTVVKLNHLHTQVLSVNPTSMISLEGQEGGLYSPKLKFYIGLGQ